MTLYVFMKFDIFACSGILFFNVLYFMLPNLDVYIYKFFFIFFNFIKYVSNFKTYISFHSECFSCLFLIYIFFLLLLRNAMCSFWPNSSSEFSVEYLLWIISRCTPSARLLLGDRFFLLEPFLLNSIAIESLPEILF